MTAIKLHSPDESIQELGQLAIQEADAAAECGSNAVVHACNSGVHLLAIKTRLPHGSFGDWLKDNWPRERQTALNYMTIAKMSKTHCIGNLTSLTEALRIYQQEAKPKIRQRVLDYIESHPKCTDDEIAEALEEKPSSIRGRRNELCKDGFVQKTGSVIRGKKPVAVYEVIPDDKREVAQDGEPELVTLSDALRGASRCKSIDADYLVEKTGISKAKIQGWLELSGEATGYKAVQQVDKSYAIHRVRVKSDAQKIKEVKSYSLHGESTPVEHLAADLDTIANTIEGVIRLYSPGCKDFSAWNRLSNEDRRNLRFLLTSAQAKVNEQFPYFLGLVAE